MKISNQNLLPTFRNVGREQNVFKNRVLVACLIMLLCVAIVSTRLVYLQLYNHSHYKTLSQENRLKVLPLAPPRGYIYSRNGVLLAENRPSFSLHVVPEKAATMSATLGEVTALLEFEQGVLSRFTKRLEEQERFESIVLGPDLDEQQVAVFSVNAHRFPGFFVEAGSSRHYPMGSILSHVVGYVGRISGPDLETIDAREYKATTHFGKTGIEKAREELLHGKVGYQTVEINAQGRVARSVEKSPPIAGADLYLTIDIDLQLEALKALGNRRGAVVALIPTTGEILAMVSTPSYDPNRFVNGISQELYKKWNSSADRPLFNRILQGQYPPGSIVKPFIAFAALEAGLRNAEDVVPCNGSFSLPGQRHRYRDWVKNGHGLVDMKTSIAESCDVYFYKLATEMGISELHRGLTKFGLGTITGVDVPGEKGGLVPSEKWKRQTRHQPWYPGETVITGIGQGFMLATPLQLASATAILATRGKVTIPHLLKHIVREGECVPVQKDLYAGESLVFEDSENWDQIIQSMIDVMHGPRGTARSSGKDSKVVLAGKTGTAQVFQLPQGSDAEEMIIPEHLKDHALFVGFAPVHSPQIVLSVVVENGGSGGAIAAPIARKMIDLFFRNQENRVPSGVTCG